MKSINTSYSGLNLLILLVLSISCAFGEATVQPLGPAFIPPGFKAQDGYASQSSNCFIPIDESYTKLQLGDDSSEGPIHLPFSFNLFGTSYQSVSINANGNLTFSNNFGGIGEKFPMTLPMVAPFWGDVDTNVSGDIYYKITATHLIVTWDQVGYFGYTPGQTRRVNTFQVIISTNDDPIIGNGNNVSFRYQDMQWASSIYGFDLLPAIVGINQGDLEGTISQGKYLLIGEFSKDNSFYDGAEGLEDGVHYLDYKCFSFNVSVEPCENTGGITYEVWNNVPSKLVELHHLPAATPPNSTSTLPSFMAPTNVAENYFARARGYLCVQMDGMYRFHLAADDRAELWLSTNQDPSFKTKIAYQRKASKPKVYNDFPTQQSSTIYLEAGKRYYIEAVLREFRFKDHMTVAWTRPDGVMETIPGSSLNPYSTSIEEMASMRAEPSQVPAETAPESLTASPNPFSDKVAVGFSLANSEEVRLEIYNLQGRLVKALHSGRAEAGKPYTYEFDGSTHANGVYILRITTGSKTVTKRVLLSR